MTTKDFRSLPPKAQEDIRRKAVNAVEQGRTRVEVAGLFGVSNKAVGQWVLAHRKHGDKALKAQKRGRPKGGSLAPVQAAQTVKAIVDKTPDQLKLPFCLWTREAVAQLIEDRFDIRLSVWTVGRYLAKWGFTPQKPVRRAFEQNPKEVKQWLDKTYPDIRDKARQQGAEIFWGDEMGLRSDHVVGRTFARKGNTPVIPGTGRRFGCNMVSAITNRGKLNFMVFQDRFTTHVFLDFLKRLTKQSGHKVFLIVDSHAVHRSKAVKQWVDQNIHLIELFYLPGYSPHLNPDELLNQDVKSNAVGRKRAHSLSEMISHVRSFLRSRQRTPRIVINYFNKRQVLYAAN
jgi:transposase